MKFDSSPINYKVVISSFHGLIILSLFLPFIVNCLNDNNNNNNNQFQSHPELTSDTQDATSNAADLPTDEPQSSPEPKDDQLEPPKELSVIRLNDTSVVLRWEFPEEHHEHLLYFKVQHKPSKRNNSVWKTDPQEISSVTRAYQINGLRPGNYFFIVTAVYDNQDNAPSPSLKYKLRAKSKIPPAEMPEMKAPEIYWREAESDFFRFKWRYDPKPSDSDDFGFLVYYRSAHVVSDFTIYNTLGTDVEIAELEPDTPYEAKVVAYNENGISEFSHPILIKTLPPKNGSSSSSPNVPTASSTIGPQTSTTPFAQSTTKRPIEMSTNHELSTPFSTTPKPGQVTPKPAPGQVDPSSFIEPLINFFKPILTDQGDAMLVVRCLLLVLLPVLFITFGLILCVRPYRNKKDPCSSSPADDVQFDLEINGYFKNSFPGVEKAYSPATNGVHTGFVNNHPHINDFESHTLFEHGGLPGSNFHPGSVS